MEIQQSQGQLFWPREDSSGSGPPLRSARALVRHRRRGRVCAACRRAARPYGGAPRRWPARTARGAGQRAGTPRCGRQLAKATASLRMQFGRWSPQSAAGHEFDSSRGRKPQKQGRGYYPGFRSVSCSGENTPGNQQRAHPQQPHQQPQQHRRQHFVTPRALPVPPASCTCGTMSNRPTRTRRQPTKYAKPDRSPSPPPPSRARAPSGRAKANKKPSETADKSVTTRARHRATRRPPPSLPLRTHRSSI